MYAIIGATGKVGYSTASALCSAVMPVKAILRNGAKAAPLEKAGCEIAVADLQDSDALAEAIGNAHSVQVIVPLSPQKDDPVADMRQSIKSLVAALIKARPQQVLAISDYGAHVTEDIGMPSIFHEFEEQLRPLDAHKIILRSAEHMHNWGRSIPAALESGRLMTFQDPVEMAMPTIAAEDLGRIAADLLLRPDSRKDWEVIHAEGPRWYSASDVATAVSQLSGRAIHAQTVPRSQWKATLERNMPASLAELLIKVNDAKNKGGLVEIEPNVGEVRYGTTKLIDALRPLVSSGAAN